MRKLKSILSLVLALCLLMSTVIVAFAEETSTPTYHATIEANGVRFNITNPDSQNPGSFETDSCSGSATHSVESGQTLTDAQITVWHDEEHELHFMGWELSTWMEDQNDWLIDSNKLYTTAEMLDYKVTTETKFVAQWKTYESYFTTDKGSFDYTVNDTTSTATPGNGAVISLPYFTTLTEVGAYVFDAELEGETFYGWDRYYQEENDNKTATINDETYYYADSVRAGRFDDELLCFMPNCNVLYVANWTGEGNWTDDNNNDPQEGEPNVHIHNNGVHFNIKEADGSTATLYSDRGLILTEGTTLNDAGIEISHDAAHTPYLLGWHIIDNGEPVADTDGSPKIFTTAEIHDYQVQNDMHFEPQWKDKYTSFVWLSVNGNGGTFDLTYVDDGGSHTNDDVPYDSFPTITAGDSFTTVGVTNITDPVHPDGKTFECWVAYYHGPTETEFGAANDDGKLLTSADILTYANTAVGYTDFIAKWKDEAIDPNGSDSTVTTYQVTIETNGVDYWITNPTADGKDTETGTVGGVSEHAIEDGKTLSESGFNVWHESQHLPFFLGWEVYNYVPDGNGNLIEEKLVDANGEPIYITTDTMLNSFRIGNDVRFVAQWRDNYDGSAEPIYESIIHLDANYGTFDIKDADGGMSDIDYTRFDQGLATGMTLADWGVTEISGLTYWDEDRAFVGWNVYEFEIYYDANGEEVGREEILVTDEPISTAELLKYPAINGELCFRAVWEGDDSDYIASVGFYAVGGTFDVAWDPDNVEDSKETRDYVGFNCLKNGKKFTEQYGVTILSDPVREGFTFEGWLALPMDMNERYNASTKLYTTAELLALPIPETDTEYAAKWKEYSIDDYLYSDPLWEEEFDKLGFSQLYITANGGTLTIVENEEEYEVPNNQYMTEGDYTFTEYYKEYDCTISSITAAKDTATLEGWTTYKADKAYWIYNETGVAPVVNDPTITVLLQGAYPDGDYTYYEYLLLKNAKVYSTTMTPKDAMDLSNGCYAVVANWANWQAVKVEGSDVNYMIDVNTVDLAVPQAAADKYKTVEEAKTALKEAALAVPTVNQDKAETVFYEITLKIQKNDGTWVTATAENFPREGIEITIPYNGLDPEKLDFIVTHLVSAGANAGEIEVLKHTEGKDGLKATVYSLSPFAVTYQNEEDAVPEATATPAPTEKPSSNVPATGDKSNVPATGDESNVLALVLMLTVSAFGAYLAYRKLRKT